MKAGLINPTNNITNQVRFEEVKDEFGNWPDPKCVDKAMVSIA